MSAFFYNIVKKLHFLLHFSVNLITVHLLLLKIAKKQNKKTPAMLFCDILLFLFLYLHPFFIISLGLEPSCSSECVKSLF